MSAIDSPEQALRSVDRLPRIALAAEIATRLYPIYEEYYVGDFSERVSRSIEIGWSYACGGTADPNEIRACREEVKDLIAFYRDDEDIELLRTLVVAVFCVLESLDADEEKSIAAVARAIWQSRDTAQYAEVMANQETPTAAQTDIAKTEEKEWQAKALELVQNWKGAPRRDMFDTLGPKPPKWVEDWKVRTASFR